MVNWRKARIIGEKMEKLLLEYEQLIPENHVPQTEESLRYAVLVHILEQAWGDLDTYVFKKDLESTI